MIGKYTHPAQLIIGNELIGVGRGMAKLLPCGRGRFNMPRHQILPFVDPDSEFRPGYGRDNGRRL